MSRTDDPHPLISRLRAMGMPEDVIFHRLVLHGWAEEAIKHAFEDRLELVVARAPEANPAPASERSIIPKFFAKKEERRERKRVWASLSPVAVGVLVALLGVSGFATFRFIKSPVVYSISIQSASADVATSSIPLSFGALPALADPDYYATFKRTLIAKKASFIDANLSTMQLVVYEKGELTLSIPILAKGKIGSWWETPAGIYKIETKEPMHFSSIGEVSMPYSLDFQGNFFIHGWPTYPDGTPVSSTYSGGCIRLSTDDAAKVFALAAIGEPVVVYNEQKPHDQFAYAVKAPTIQATGYLVADLDTGAVLASKDASSTAFIASITKLVSALVATEYINLDRKVTVPKDAIVYTTVPRLKQGQEYKAYDLLFLLLQESSNEAAETLASAVGRDQFVAHMNAKAKAIGLTDTHFSDPSGAKDDVSTPEDLFTLLRYIYDNRRFVFDITKGSITDSAYGKPAFGALANFNVIKNSPATLLGGKVGETNQAGETYAGIFQVKVGDSERKLAIIALGSQDSHDDVLKLLNFVHSSYAPAQ
jgi:D-alanyl-D-alanine carboxypeptidase (penicillin-binding protein 5/6)